MCCVWRGVFLLSPQHLVCGCVREATGILHIVSVGFFVVDRQYKHNTSVKSHDWHWEGKKNYTLQKHTLTGDKERCTIITYTRRFFFFFIQQSFCSERGGDVYSTPTSLPLLPVFVLMTISYVSSLSLPAYSVVLPG